MAEQGVMLSMDAARRAGRAVRDFERAPRNDGPQRRTSTTPSRVAAIGKADATIASGASGTISIWLGQAASLVDSGENLTAFALDPGIIQGQWVYVTWIGGDWFAWPAVNEHVGKPGSAITKGTSGSVTIWRQTSGVWSATAIVVTAAALGANVPAGKFCVVSSVGGVWLVTPWEC